MTDDGTTTLVPMGELAVATNVGILAALGLGSCVAVLMHDAEKRVGGLVHVLLPSRSLSRLRDKPARSAETAVPLLVEQMLEAGGVQDHIVGRMIGGACMFADLMASGTVHIGERNLAACRLALRSQNIPVIAEAVGGESSRSVWFDIEHGLVTVRTPYGESIRI